MTARQKRALALFGMLMVGSGALLLPHPSAAVRLWSQRRWPRWLRRVASHFEQHNWLTRLAGLARIGAGMALIERMTR